MRALLGFTVLLLIDTCDGYCSADTNVPSADSTTVNYIQSPSYPNPYPNSQTCSWSVTASGSDTIFYYLEYESLENYFDRLYIYDNSVRVYYSEYYSSDTSGVTSTQTLATTFTSDGSVRYGGFSLAYMAVDRTSIPSCGSTITVTSPTSQQLSYLSSVQGYPCTWTIQASSGSNIIQYSIPLLRGSTSWNDGGSYSYVYDPSNSTYVSSSDSIQLTAVYGSDFVVIFEEVGNTNTPSPYYSSVSTKADICDTSTVLTASSTWQYLATPDYPSPYSSQLYCDVTITSWSNDESVVLQMLDFDVEASDWLHIYHGVSSDYQSDLIYPYTGYNVTSLGSSFHLTFASDYYSNLRGFYLRYSNASRTIPACAPQTYTSYDVNGTSQSISSMNYPSDYPNYHDEYWLLIKPLETDTIVIEFTDIDIEGWTYNCPYDYVDIYDGPCTDYSMIDRICGSDKLNVIDKSGLYILLHFHTDGSVTEKGFDVNVYIDNSALVDTEASTEDSSIPAYVYGLIVVGCVIFLIVVVCVVVQVNQRKGTARVGSSAQLVPATQPNTKFTTSVLLLQFQQRAGSSQNDRIKVKRKPQGQPYHPKPNTPGPGVKILNMSEQPIHPPSNIHDPAYPPVYLGSGTHIAPIAPSLVPNQAAPPISPTLNPNIGMVPPPFAYMTPAEARDNGTYP